MPAVRPASLKVRALQWLAQREHSRNELREKLLHLLKRGQPAASAENSADNTDPAVEVETLLLWLEEHGHLSDARFTESRVHARASRFGNRRIQQELQQHGVTLDAKTREALTQSEFARARALWSRKYGTPASDAAGRLRQMRFLAGRGFSMGVVQQVLKRGASGAGDGDQGSEGA